MAEQQVAIGTLVADQTIYPRHNLDPFNLQQLRQALAAGAQFPPLIVETGSMRLVDGFHRHAAIKEAYGDEHLVMVDARDYPSDGALFAEAMLLNSRHGRSMTSYDRAKSILLARKLGLSDDETAQCLQITRPALDQLVLTRTAIGPDDQVVPIKLTSSPALAGRSVTAAQLAANQKAGGLPVVYYANQLLNALTGGLVDLSNGDVVGRLQQLQRELEKRLAGAAT